MYRLYSYEVGEQGRVLAESPSENNISTDARLLVIGQKVIQDTPSGPMIVNREEGLPNSRRVHDALMLGPDGFTPRLYSSRCPASYPYWEPCENWNNPDPERRCKNPKGPWRKPRSWAGIRKNDLKRCRHCYLRQGNESSAAFLREFNKNLHGKPGRVHYRKRKQKECPSDTAAPESLMAATTAASQS